MERENHQLHNLLNYDTLTNAHTRYWYQENVEDDIDYYIGFADVNNLHKINEQYGHEVGDKTLCAVCKELQKYGDVVRFGGDEFILIAYDKKALYLNYKQNLDFTIAVVHKPTNKTIAEIQNKADKLMLKKKK